METRCVNTVRVLSADVVEKANAGHPGAPMGCAPMAHVLWSSIMNYDATDPHWYNRDRYVQSNGHACALQYVMLHLTGYDLTLEDLKQFRQMGSRTPGHPENGVTPGVEVSTGPLGQGISNAVGLAIAERHLAAHFNKPDFPVIDHFTYVIMGDGCMQEGVASEACSLAGHLGLGKLIALYDDNKITIDGSTELSFTEDVLKRFEAYGWDVQSVEDGNNDIDGIREAVLRAQRVTDKPSLIRVRTTIGFGSLKAGSEATHGAPLGASDVAHVKTSFGFDPAASFVVPDDVRAFYADKAAERRAARGRWQELFDRYRAMFPLLGDELVRRFKGELPSDWETALPSFSPADKADATRNLSHKVLLSLSTSIPELVGGSADLTPSNKTQIKSVDFQRATPEGRYIRFGVREHAMAAIANGMAAHGGVLPYVATFLVFAGYALGSMRLSALSHFRVLYIMTHDSVQLGEDGPTHQPVETLATLRSIPNMLVLRPADGRETAGAYAAALHARSAHRPAVIALSRQNLPHLEGSSVEGVSMGAYVVAEIGGGEGEPVVLTIVATGSVVQLAIAAGKLVGRKVRVVSMPSWELFEEQEDVYKRSVFLEGVPTLAVEAASSMGWSRYSHACVSIDKFGLSAKGEDIYRAYGFTPEAVADKAAKLLAFYAARPVPSLMEKPF